MRDFLNAILATINTALLSDLEFEGLTITSYGYDVATYEALLAVIDARETISNTRDRLRFIFLAKGVAIGESIPAKSEIYIGGAL